jgi:hypothetical protein
MDDFIVYFADTDPPAHYIPQTMWMGYWINYVNMTVWTASRPDFIWYEVPETRPSVLHFKPKMFLMREIAGLEPVDVH